jgi:hypothetical protein
MAMMSGGTMSKLGLGVLAGTLALGGVQFGMASDSLRPSDASLRPAGQDVAAMVNRSGKGDRDAVPGGVPSATLSFSVNGLDATSIAMRLPLAAREQAGDPVKVAPAKAGRAKAMIACEPVVSPLTEVAKLLGPGRCVT